MILILSSLASRTILCAALALPLGLMAGCGKNTGAGSGTVNSPFQENQSTQLNDTSGCVGAPPAGSTIIGIWASSTKNSVTGARDDLALTVQRNSLTATLTCSNSVGSHTVSVTVPARITGGAIITLATDKQETNVNPDCKVSIPMGTLAYSMVGSCAVITINARSSTMMRSGF